MKLKQNILQCDIINCIEIAFYNENENLRLSNADIRASLPSPASLAPPFPSAAAASASASAAAAAAGELFAVHARHAGVECDMASPESIQGACHRVLELYGRVDVLVNCAGPCCALVRSRLCFSGAVLVAWLAAMQ